MNTIVSKFGGSSVANASQIRKVADIIRSDDARRVIVVSAPGKRSSEDEKITDILIDCHARAATGEDVRQRYAVIRERYVEIARDLGIEHGIDAVLDEVEERIRNRADRNAVVSRGEYLGAHLIARFLGYEFLDAAEIIRFADEHSVDDAITDRLIGAAIDPDKRYVIPGFYGAYEDGRIQLFTRGGSDITAALVARGIGAEVYENWTDVSGLLSADPRIVDDPAPIPRISYNGLQELAFLGAVVFHEEAVAPVAEASIPINIRNTNEPDHPGTIIGAEEGNAIGGVAGKTGVGAIGVSRAGIGKDRGFLRRLDEALNTEGIRLLQVARGSDSALAVVDGVSLAAAGDEVTRRVESALDARSVTMDGPVALVGAVDRGIGLDAVRIAAVLDALDKAGIVVRMVLSGYSSRSFFVLVDEPRYRDAIRAVYAAIHRD